MAQALDKPKDPETEYSKAMKFVDIAFSDTSAEDKTLMAQHMAKDPTMSQFGFLAVPKQRFAQYLLGTGRITPREFFDDVQESQFSLTALGTLELSKPELQYECSSRKLKHSGSRRVLAERLIRDIYGKTTDEDRARKAKAKQDEAPKWAKTHGLPPSLCPSSLAKEASKVAYKVYESIARDWHDGYDEIEEMEEEFDSHLQELCRTLVAVLGSGEKCTAATVQEIMKFVDTLVVGECWVSNGIGESRHWREENFTWTLGGSFGMLEARTLESLVRQVANYLLYSLFDLPLVEEEKRLELVRLWLATMTVREIPVSWTPTTQKDSDACAEGTMDVDKTAHKDKKPRVDSFPTEEQSTFIKLQTESQPEWSSSVKPLPEPKAPKPATLPVPFVGDARYDGPKHRRTRGYWIENEYEFLRMYIPEPDEEGFEDWMHEAYEEQDGAMFGF